MRMRSSFRVAIVGIALALNVPTLLGQQFAGQQFAGRYPHIAPTTTSTPSAGPGYYAAAMQGAGTPPTALAAPPSMPRNYPGAQPRLAPPAQAPFTQAPSTSPQQTGPLAGLKTSLGRFANPTAPEIPPPPKPTFAPRQAAWAGGANAYAAGSANQSAAYAAPVSPYADYAADVAARVSAKPGPIAPVAYNAPAYNPTAYNTAPNNSAPYRAAPSAAAQTTSARLAPPTASRNPGYGAAYLQANNQPMLALSGAAGSVPAFADQGPINYGAGPTIGAPAYSAPGAGPAGAPFGGGFVGPTGAAPQSPYGNTMPGGQSSSIWQQPAMPDPISSGGYAGAGPLGSDVAGYGPSTYGAMPGGCDEPEAAYFDPGVPSCGPWFASVSGLIMTRDVPNNAPLAYVGADPHVPSTLNTETAGFDWSGGVEAKLGRMIGDRWAMEVVYWWLDPSNGYLSERSLGNEINSRLDMSDQLFDGFALSNIFENSREQRVYRMNQFQNVEINVLQQALVVDPQTRYGMAYFMGARYFKYREILEYYAVMANSEFSDNDMTTQAGYHIRMRNSLIGWQIGARGHMYLGNRLRLYATPRVGLFANAISQDQDLCMVIRLNSTKTDVTMLGQIDLGASFQIFRCCSLFAGYRAMGITGVANADDQIPRGNFSSLPDLAQINSSGSIILHGWNTGIQFQF